MKKPIKTFHLVLFFMPVVTMAQSKVMTIDLDKVPTVELRPTRVIDDSGQPLFSGSFTNITYDSFEHRVYLAERSQIVVLTPEGKVLSRIDRRGQGPGEFRLIVRIAVDKEHLFIADKENLRIQILNKDFSYVRSVPINGVIDDIAHAGHNQLIVHTSAPKGKLLHRYDLNAPYRPVESFLEAISSFEKISNNPWSINGVRIAINANCIYALCTALPVLRIFCRDKNGFQEIRFVGNAVNVLYEELPSTIKTTTGATPVTVFSRRILPGMDGLLYWLCISSADKKVFVFDPFMQNRKAYSLELPSNTEAEKYYEDFCLAEDILYLLNASNGTIQVYQLKAIQQSKNSLN